METYTGTKAIGLRLPIIKEGDNLNDIIIDSIKKSVNNNEYIPQENDIIGITESLVARAEGRYVTVDDIVEDLKNKFPNNEKVFLYNPIFSRNRFSIILKAIARYFDNVVIIADTFDEVGNYIVHDITKVDYEDFYDEICRSENASCKFFTKEEVHPLQEFLKVNDNVIDCTLHVNKLDNYVGYMLQQAIKDELNYWTLKDICNNVSEWGLLGSNKVGEEMLKLFPDSKNQQFVENVKETLQNEFGLTNVDVMIYGDGCYKDAASGIWEFADPVVSPAYTKGLEGTPNELKLKYLADEEFKNLNGEELQKHIKERIANKNVKQGTMETQGTTPRKYTDLLGSLMDLISGSGDKGTPVVIVQNYFKNYSE